MRVTRKFLEARCITHVCKLGRELYCMFFGTIIFKDPLYASITVKLRTILIVFQISTALLLLISLKNSLVH